MRTRLTFRSSCSPSATTRLTLPGSKVLASSRTSAPMRRSATRSIMPRASACESCLCAWKISISDDQLRKLDLARPELLLIGGWDTRLSRNSRFCLRHEFQYDDDDHESYGRHA